MSDEMNHDDLDRLLHGVDPLAPDASPNEQESRSALNELRATRLSDATAGGRPRFARPRVLAGGTLALGASATVATLALGAFSSSPAFAVTSNDNGTVTVKVFRAGEVAAVNARLQALGVRAKFIQVNAVASGCPAPGAVPTQVPLPHAVVIKPGEIPANKTIVLGADGSGHVGYLPKAVLRRITANAPAGVPPHIVLPPLHVVHGHLVGPNGKVQLSAAGSAVQRVVGPNGVIVVKPAPANTSTTGTTTSTTNTSTTDTTTTNWSTTTTGTSTTGGVGSEQRPAPGSVPPPLLRAIAAVRCAAHVGGGGTSTTSTSTNTSTTNTSTTNTSTNASTTGADTSTAGAAY